MHSEWMALQPPPTSGFVFADQSLVQHGFKTQRRELKWQCGLNHDLEKQLAHVHVHIVGKLYAGVGEAAHRAAGFGVPPVTCTRRCPSAQAVSVCRALLFVALEHATMEHATMEHATMEHATMEHATMEQPTMDHA
jgi:hypothetical protein